jgi:hypothetical protein
MHINFDLICKNKQKNPYKNKEHVRDRIQTKWLIYQSIEQDKIKTHKIIKIQKLIKSQNDKPHFDLLMEPF